MTESQLKTLRFACANDPDRVIELIGINWTLLVVDFKIIFNEKENDTKDY